jgi:hypothetical protein
MTEARAAPGPGKLLLPVLVAVLLLPAALGSSHTVFNDGDVSWHIATGRWILEHAAIPRTDPFSFTWAGKPWVPIEWLAEVIYASAYRLAGYAGVAALVSAALMALNGVVFFNANRWVRPLLVIVAMDVVLIPMLLARPHVLAWPLLAFWIWLMLRAREQDRAPPIAAAFLMTVWANLHGSFVFGLGLAALFGLEALLSSADKGRAFRQWLIFGVACALAVCINANGVEGALHPLRFTQLEMLPMIDEWKPSNPKVTPFFFGALAVALAAIVWKRPRLHPVRWAILALFLAGAMYQARHQAMFAIVAAMILPEGLAKGMPRRLDGDHRAAALVALTGALLLIGARALTPPDNETNPWGLIASVPQELRGQPVMNDYSFGGPLILHGVRPYVDGRGDMYGDRFILNYAKIVGGDPRAFSDAVHQWNIRWAIAPHRDKKMIAMLDRMPGWRRIRQDRVGVVFAAH